MPSLEQALEEKAQSEIAAQEKEKRAEEQNAKAQEFVKWERLDRLMASDDVKWLLGEMQVLVDAEQAKALNAGLPDPEANKARQRHDIAKELHDLLGKRHLQQKNSLFGEKKD